MSADLQFLQHAIRLGARGLGRTWPNPSVGCVIVKNGVVMAAATTADGGRPHAETQALAVAGDARGAMVYVSLEPCAHQGQTPPCAQALIDAGVARVVIAAVDPDPRVSGKGIAMLEAAGIAVEKLLLPEAARLHRGFFKRVREGMPYVTMKLATSLDGCMADSTGKSQWITGEQARAHGHALRASVDAVVTGIGTVLADDPQLTARSGLSHPKLVRVVCDSKLRLPLGSRLVRAARQQPVWIVTTATGVEQAASHATELREAGCKFLVVEDEAISPLSILKTLGNEGLTRVLVEAGPALSTAFLAAGMVDTLHWYRAAILLGNTGAAAITALDTSLAAAPRAQLAARMAIGADEYSKYEF